MLPPQATIPAKAIVPWAKKVEAESGGRIKVQIFNTMQLGGTPPQLFDQAKDGIVDITWTVLGYTPGRFPKTEVFEVPFLTTTGEASSKALWEYVQKNAPEEFKDVKLIAVTGRPDSTLGQAADVVLDVAVSQEACPLNLAPTSSTTAMLALGDALAMVLLEARGFQQDDFARFHPGGSLGRVLLTRVNQIMRKATQLAVASPEATVLEVLKKMTKCRTGAAAIIDADGHLAGVFTHGDLARHYQKHADLGALPVGQFMTKSPITVRGDKLAAEALHVLKTHRIDDLIVVDEDNRPVGIIDSQDLSRLQGV
jgi:KpsF/GutQ family protein